MQNVSKQSGEKAIGSFKDRFRFSIWKLTALYAAILVIILFLSSSIIYSAFSSRLEHRFKAGGSLPSSFAGFILVPPPTIEDVRADLVRSLIWANSLLLIGAGIASYWLARSTLKPLQQMYEEQRRFFGDASHELRTPLSILGIGLENQLADSTISGSMREHLVSHLEEVNRMGKLVSGLLTLAQFDEHNNAKQKNFVPVSLTPLITHAVERLQILAKQHQVNLFLAQSTNENMVILSNEEMLLQTITNVIKNSIVYNHAGGQVRISMYSSKEQVFISIIDTGAGIASQDLGKVFSRFYRTDRSRSSQTGGSGLGLSIVRSSMRYLGGTIKIESEIEKGTSITLGFSLQ